MEISQTILNAVAVSGRKAAEARQSEIKKLIAQAKEDRIFWIKLLTNSSRVPNFCDPDDLDKVMLGPDPTGTKWFQLCAQRKYARVQHLQTLSLADLKTLYQQVTGLDPDTSIRGWHVAPINYYRF